MAAVPKTRPGFFQTRQGRILQENLTAYLFLFPAGLLIFLFGIFPVAFAFFVSLHRWRRFPEEYLGLENYVRSLGSVGYVLFFWLALGALLYAALIIYRLWREQPRQYTSFLFFIPGLVNAAAGFLFVRWFFELLPIVLDIPQRIRGQERVPGLFMNELSISLGMVSESGNMMLLGLALAVIVSLVFLRYLGRGDLPGRPYNDANAQPTSNSVYLLRTTLFFALLASAVLILQLTLVEIQFVVAEAQAAGTDLPVWSQVILISLGAALLVLAYVVWQRANKQYEQRRFFMLALAALLLMGGGYLLVAELPQALAEADGDLLNGFNVTVMFSIGTVPVQLAIGLGLAYLLFQNIKGKSFFRVVYFLPYITPFVATSVVFKVLFSHREQSSVNQLVGLFGIPPQKWLLEPIGIFRLMFGPQTPDWLAGPGLALVVIMIYTVWTYIGYDTVVFLAGLGSISGELYEAARIDGASSWSLFRHITLPLLSPTTFFLSLIAIIGTFKAFTQIWIMRSPAAGSSVDTASIYIFETVRATEPSMGYGSAMSFVLFGVILLLTIFQNRIAGSKVFYG
jgi:ABC-type sugar transport system permease subunit